MAAAAACPRTCRTIQVMPVLFVFQFALQCWCFYLPVVDMTTRSHKDTRMDLWLREVSCPWETQYISSVLVLVPKCCLLHTEEDGVLT